MSGFTAFIWKHRTLIFFGFVLTFFSGFGQTFLVSMYVPEIGAAFDLSNTALSSLYAAGTLGSAFTLTWAGRYVDVLPLARFAMMVLLGLIGAQLVLSFSIHPAMVLLGFYGVRFFGQGLMSHTSISTMARAFVANRGKAISLATLGHPVGEATLPLTIAFLIGLVGWRSTLQLSAVFLGIVVIPLVLFLLKGQARSLTHPGNGVATGASGSSGKPFNPLQLLRTNLFWIILPAVFMVAYLNTAVLFFQVQLGDERGWERSWVAGSLAAFAGANALAMLLSGPVVDRLSARRVFPFYMVTYVIGLCLLAAIHAPVTYPIALALFGFSNGAGSTIKNALLAEVYGTDIIGSVRSLFTTVMVLSTAVGPIVFGLMLDAGFSFSIIFLLSAGVVVLAIIWSFRVWHHFTQKRLRAKLRRFFRNE